MVVQRGQEPASAPQQPGGRKAEILPLILESGLTFYYSLSPDTIAAFGDPATTEIDSLVLGLDPSDG